MSSNRRWARPKERGPAGQLALPGFAAAAVAEKPRIQTDHVAAGVVDTSRDAAKLAQQDAAEVRTAIMAFLRAAGPLGATCDEFAAATHKSPNQVSGRFTDLHRLGMIYRSGERRKTKAGADAHVWKAYGQG